MWLVWVGEIRHTGLGKLHKPVKYKELGGHLSSRVVKRVPDAMEELGEFFDSDHFPENEPGFIELIVSDIVFSSDQLGLDSL